MPNIRNWEDWDEVEQETNQQAIREKINKKVGTKNENKRYYRQRQRA